MSKYGKKLFALICAVVLFVCSICTPALAVTVLSSKPPSTVKTSNILTCTQIPLYIDKEYIGDGMVVGSVPYVPLRAFTECMLQDSCESDWDQETGTATIRSDVLVLKLKIGECYMTANDRYLYLSDSVYNVNGTIIVPLRIMAQVFCLDLELDREDWKITIDTGNICVPVSGDRFYDETDLYWLSRVISSEAGNQSMEGMIGVGNVVLNRKNDSHSYFGDSISEVIFQAGQFDVVRTGAIYDEPREIAVIAAKLCLEGYNTVGAARWFVNPDIGQTAWFDQHRTYVTTIGDHLFYA